MSKITLTTVKKFIRENKDKLYINVKSDFDGMTDCVQPLNGGFTKVIINDKDTEQTLGIHGAWFVGSSRDYFTPFESDTMTGISVSNCCGHFILSILK